MGDVIGDLNSRRGKVQGVEPKRGNQNIKAIVPMAEVVNYASVLNGLTADRGVFTMEFSRYEEVPSHLSQKLIAELKAEKEKS
jgi:elongation factor G